MKKIVIALLALVFTALPSIVSAGYSSGGAVLLTRLEVSKDNATWINYLAETDSGGQTLTISPGDTVYFRLKTWNTGDTPSINIVYSAAYTNPTSIDALTPFQAGSSDDLDGDAILFYGLDAQPDMTAGTMAFHLDGVDNGTDDVTGFQSGGMVARVAAGTADQTVILATVTITGADLYVVWWKKLLFPRAHADDQATTQARILVSNPPAVVAAATPAVTLPVTGPDPAFAAESASDSAAPTTLPSSNKYLWTKALEWTNTNLLTYKKSSKAKTLDRYANQRVAEMQYALSQSDNSSLDKSLDRYNWQKSKALDYAKSAGDESVVNQVKQQTVDQEKTMTEVQLKLENAKDLQNKVVDVQKKTADKVVDTVNVVQGGQAGTIVAGEIKNVWYAAGTTANSSSAPAGWSYAPGTSAGNTVTGGSGGTAGTTVQGGTSTVAPGTTGTGTSAGTTVQGGSSTVAPGTTSGGSGGQTVAPGN